MEEPRFQAAISRFDSRNAQDPRGYELPYARRLSGWVDRLAPDASAELRLAARAQHLARWEMPRHEYPAGRLGYLQWRERLKQFHAQEAGIILRAAGYPDATVTRVQDLIRKRNFPRDPEGRVLEDALCLTFLEDQLAATTEKVGKEKMVDILRKTWRKMTPRAQQLAQAMNLTTAQRELLARALQ